MREFDLVDKAFVAGGFTLPVAKQDVIWKDENTLWVATDFGEGSLTTSGYPRIVKEWKRGTPLAEARTVFEGTDRGHLRLSRCPSRRPSASTTWSSAIPEFFKGDVYLSVGDELVQVPIPLDADFQGVFDGPAPLLAAQRLDGRRDDLPAGSAARRRSGRSC